ncbi:hypothetical protein WA026_013622 [Henosepilachna vigintioctopunctata]|uniref:Uncharacterized protein n=1 Tax=Henosepilachna vigintioctopunctata TaxID=420089 RepID=A0AAW1UXB3_9CUCU
MGDEEFPNGAPEIPAETGLGRRSAPTGYAQSEINLAPSQLFLDREINAYLLILGIPYLNGTTMTILPTICESLRENYADGPLREVTSALYRVVAPRQTEQVD